MEEHKEYLDDWIFLMLLRLLHRQGMDMLSSVHYKLALVLELIRWAEILKPGARLIIYPIQF